VVVLRDVGECSASHGEVVGAREDGAAVAGLGANEP
jgi:hypothetical protein